MSKRTRKSLPVHCCCSPFGLPLRNALECRSAEVIRKLMPSVHGDKDTWVSIKNIAYGKKMMVNAASINADTLRGADHRIPWKRRDDLKAILLKLY